MNKIYSFVGISFITLLGANSFFAPKEIFLSHHCSLQKERGRCHIENKEHALGLDFEVSPLPINPLDALNYKASFFSTRPQDPLSIESIKLRILGHDMIMKEELYFPLKRKEDHSYKAKRIFPACTENLMTWRIYLTAKSNQGIIKTTFDLAVSRHTPHTPDDKG